MQTNCFHCGRDDAPHPRPQPKFDVPITAAEVKKIFSDCDDFEMRTVRIGLESRLTVCVCWLDGVAYMAPFVDSERPALWRTLLRRPQPDNKFRPPEYGSENRRRQR